MHDMCNFHGANGVRNSSIPGIRQNTMVKAATIVFDANARDQHCKGFQKRKQERREYGYLKEAMKQEQEKKELKRKQQQTADEMMKTVTLETKTTKAARKAATREKSHTLITNLHAGCSIEVTEGSIPAWMGGSRDNAGGLDSTSVYGNAIRALKLEDRMKKRDQEEWTKKLKEDDERAKIAALEKKSKKRLNLFKNNTDEDSDELGDLAKGLKGSANPNTFFSLTTANLALHNAQKEPTTISKSGLGATMIEGGRGKATSVAVSKAATRMMKEADKRVMSKKIAKAKKKAKRKRSSKKK